ncbi:MAG: DUF2202 domain-containing protein [Sulfurovum sp.]|nr:DUF2202 domain-containing protein [Sulfurovum sp.]
MIKQTFIATTLASLLLVGCGGTTDTATPLAGATETTMATTGYFIDAAVNNLDYDCIADNDYNKTTKTDGAFTCSNMSKVRFRLGNLVLGEITALPQDNNVMPQDLVGVDRTEIYNQRVTEIARLLQSCDTDGNATNGISIDDATKAELLANIELNTTFDENKTNEYLEFASRETTMTKTQARAHLHATLQTLETSATTTTQNTNGQQNGQNGTAPQTGGLVDVNASPISELTEDAEHAIEYMVNEEKLAYDVYLNLYKYHLLDSNKELFQFKNIAESSETKHMQTVEDLAAKYGLEKASDLESGKFNVPEVQKLYDTLYEMGTASPEDALKVGCMVEVTDINDLEADLLIAQESNAQDVVDVFTKLRDGSYPHYWSFDKALIGMEVTEGCCSVGTIDGVNYCHPEYPQNTKGGGRR